MKNTGRKFSLGSKITIFVILTILLSVSGVCILSFIINVNQIDTYFKRLTINNARNFASFVDPDFLKELKEIAQSEEYQALRDRAEEEKDEVIVQDYLKEKGLWERYEEHRQKITTYLNNMSDIEYLYIVVWGGKNATHDMYLVDDYENPVYETGYYELREPEFAGIDPDGEIDPVISNGDWGWLCSGYAPVYDSDGNYICHVGCDVQMEDVMRERRINLFYMILCAVACTVIVFIFAILFANRIIIRPLNEITRAMKKFKPEGTHGYEEAGVIDLDIKKKDEIGEIYEEIHSMQTRIVDYIDDITEIQHDKELAEEDVRNKEKAIGIISRDAYKDSLTGVGNKTAYIKKTNEINEQIRNGFKDFAVVMIDINGLKAVNDNYGHANGDLYIKGCCHIICEVFKHSPVYRIGGDEFAVILTGEDFLIRQSRVKEIREIFAKAYGNEEAEPWARYSASVGMADFAVNDKSVEFVFQRADKQMYEEKEKFKHAPMS